MSLGKDAIGSWLQLRRYFKRIVPVYLYIVPDLEFVERSVKYYEDFFQCKIIQYPHPSLYRLLANCIFQAPENCLIVEEANLGEFDYAYVSRAVKEAEKLPADLLAANGVRMNDSINRRTAIQKSGSVNYGTGVFYPIYDWDKKRLVKELREAKVKLPVDYKWFGRSFDGIDYRFLEPLRKHSPKDFQKVLQFFPLADVELFRRKQLERLHGQA